MNPHKGSLSLAGAIVIAGALIAAALIWINKPASEQASPSVPATSNAVVAPVTASDHILGNPNAPIKLIEYSDLSCPFCKAFNPTLERVMSDYGPSGQVAWIYRHFPLFKPVSDIVPHPNSLDQALALECAAQLGGNTGFFAFEKRWFAGFPDDGAARSSIEDRAQINSVAKDIGLDMDSFKECLAGGAFKPTIEKAYKDGLAAGITGTPYTVVVTPSGNKIPLVGMQSYATLKTMIDTLITSLGTNTGI